MLYNIFQYIKENKLFHIGALMTAMGVFTGILGYAFQVIAGNILLPKEFATFTASMGLIAVCLAPLNTISVYLAREVAKISATSGINDLQKLYFSFVSIIFCLGLCLTIIATSFQGTLNSYLKYEGAYLSILLVSIISLSSLMAVNIGFLQGFQRFVWLASINSGQTIFKIFIVIILVSNLGLGLDGALIGVSLATLIAWMIGFGRIGTSFKTNRQSGISSSIKAEKMGAFTPVVLANVSFALMTQADVVMVNYYFVASIASEYAAAAILGKAVLYLPGGIILALLPMVAEKHAKLEDSDQMVVQAAIATFVLCSMLAIIYYFFSQEIMQILFRNKFESGGQYLKYYGFAILPMAMVMVAEYFLIAKGKILFAWIFFVVSPFQLLAVHFLHREADSVIFIVGFSCSIVMVVGYFLLWLDLSSNKKLKN